MVAHAAGELVLSMQGTAKVERKEDGSNVTEADIAANALISKALSQLTPNIPVLAEENEKKINDHILKHVTDFWAVDPLDVTQSYIEGRDGYSINIALLENHVPILGVLLFPAKGECYFTGEDGFAYRQFLTATPEKIEVQSFDKLRQEGANIRSVMSIALRSRGNEDAINAKQKSINTIVTTGQHRACMVATGQALMCSEQEGFRLWDTAPTYAIVRAAGGDIRQNNGHTLQFNTGLVLPDYTVAHPSLLDRILPEESDDTNAPFQLAAHESL